MPVRGCIYIYIYIMQKQQNSTYLPVSGQSSLPVLVDWSTVFHSQSTNLGMQWNLLQGSSLLQTCFIQQVEDISKKTNKQNKGTFETKSLTLVGGTSQGFCFKCSLVLFICFLNLVSSVVDSRTSCIQAMTNL